jgi:hypothetical protein
MLTMSQIKEVLDMAKTHAMSIREFLHEDYKVTKKVDKTYLRAAAASIVPLMTIPYVTAMAHPQVMPVNSVIADKTLNVIAHALDPVVDLLVAISFPIASVVMIGSCFYFMFGNSEKAWSGIQSAGLGYILIQVSPLLLNVLKEIGGVVS